MSYAQEHYQNYPSYLLSQACEGDSSKASKYQQNNKHNPQKCHDNDIGYNLGSRNLVLPICKNPQTFDVLKNTTNATQIPPAPFHHHSML